MKKYLLIGIYVKYCQWYTLTTTQIWQMHWSLAVVATSRENDHSQEYIYTYIWDLGSSVKGALAIRRIFSLVDMITKPKLSNCPNVFKFGLLR